MHTFFLRTQLRIFGGYRRSCWLPPSAPLSPRRQLRRRFRLRIRTTFPSRWKSLLTVRRRRSGSVSENTAISKNGCRSTASSLQVRMANSERSGHFATALSSRFSSRKRPCHTATPSRCGKAQRYNLYHGTVEAVPVTATTSKLVYTLVFDNSMLADDAAREKDIQARTAQFTRALNNMIVGGAGSRTGHE
jgi:hypothetical protein